MMRFRLRVFLEFSQIQWREHPLKYTIGPTYVQIHAPCCTSRGFESAQTIPSQNWRSKPASG
jgi:pyruvate/2-oxoacid:ferredoxin oxidoreductase beta subunit